MAAAVEAAADDARWIRVLSDSLAEHMKKIHGGSWVVRVDHRTRFLSIRQVSDSDLAQPKRGKVV